MKYKIKKLRKYPSSEIDWNKGVYLGMSMNNKMFDSKETICQMVKIIPNHVKQIAVLVGDYLDRYNEQIFNGCSEAEAINKSLEKGIKLTSLFEKAVSNCEDIPSYNFIYSKQFSERDNYKKKLKKFANFYATHNEFHKLVDYTIDVFLRRRRDEIKVKREEAHRLCKYYLFEELVIFEMLAEDNLRINIYPGNQLPIIKKIAAGELAGISESLEKLHAIEIKFRPV